MTDLKNAEQVYRLAMRSVTRRSPVGNRIAAAGNEKATPSPAYVKRRFPLAAAVIIVFLSLSAVVFSISIRTDDHADSIITPGTSSADTSHPGSAALSYSKAEDDIQALLISFDGLNEQDKKALADKYRAEYDRLRSKQSECCATIRNNSGEAYTLLDARLDDKGVLKIELYSRFNTSLRLDSRCICFRCMSYMSENVPILCEQLIGGEIIPINGVLTLYVRSLETGVELSGDKRVVLYEEGKYPDDLNGSLSFEFSADKQRVCLVMDRYDRLISQLEEYS